MTGFSNTNILYFLMLRRVFLVASLSNNPPKTWINAVELSDQIMYIPVDDLILKIIR